MSQPGGHAHILTFMSRTGGGGFDSTCALIRALRRALTGDGGSWSALGLDGRRPLRPLRLSVLTTAVRQTDGQAVGLDPGAASQVQVRLRLPSRTIPTARHFWKRQY